LLTVERRNEVTVSQEFYSPEEVAAKLGLHVRTVRRFIRAGKLKATRLGKQYRVAVADLNALAGADPTPVVPRTRRVLVSSIVDVDAISRTESDRITTLVTSVFTAARDSANKRIDTLYYEEQGRLRITIHADAGYTASLLGMIDGVLADGRRD
jgi:excisionase family DNA binding protein